MSGNGDYRTAVSGFEKLYKRVTERMWFYVGEHLKDGAEQQWLVSLIRGFKDRFDEWPTHPDASMGRAAVETLASPDVSDFARLCGFAYLHICFDLPWVISRSLYVMGPNQLIQPVIPLHRAREIYLDIAPQLQEVYVEHAKANGMPTFPGKTITAATARLFPDAFRLMAVWTTLLRSVAWIHADTLRESNAIDRAYYEYVLAARVTFAIQDSLKECALRVPLVLSPPKMMVPLVAAPVAEPAFHYLQAFFTHVYDAAASDPATFISVALSGIAAGALVLYAPLHWVLKKNRERVLSRARSVEQEADEADGAYVTGLREQIEVANIFGETVHKAMSRPLILTDEDMERLARQDFPPPPSRATPLRG